MTDKIFLDGLAAYTRGRRTDVDDNLFDRSYQNHLAGVNRVVGSDIPVGTKLYGAERTFSAGLVVSF